MSAPQVEVITDKDYPELVTPEMKVVKHTLWPVSYINADGEQRDTIYTWNPVGIAADYVVGESFVVETLHPVAMPDDKRQARIAEIKAELARLEGEA